MIDLRLGDCLEVMKEILDKSIDMILCDLPYGTTACKWDTIIPFDKLWEQYKRIIKDNGAIVLFGSEPFASKLRLSNEKMYKYDWVWEKDKGTGFGFCNKQPLRKTEYICVFYKKQPYYNWIDKKLERPYYHTLPISKSQSSPISNINLNIDKSRKYMLYECSHKTNIIKISRKRKNSLHPTQKPVALLEYLIKTYTNENDLILDNCAGSMSTAIACINTNRNGIMIEKDDHYFEVGSERVRKHFIEIQNKNEK